MFCSPYTLYWHLWFCEDPLTFPFHKRFYIVQKAIKMIFTLRKINSSFKNYSLKGENGIAVKTHFWNYYF